MDVWKRVAAVIQSLISAGKIAERIRTGLAVAAATSSLIGGGLLVRSYLSKEAAPVESASQSSTESSLSSSSFPTALNSVGKLDSRRSENSRFDNNSPNNLGGHFNPDYGVSGEDPASVPNNGPLSDPALANYSGAGSSPGYLDSQNRLEDSNLLDTSSPRELQSPALPLPSIAGGGSLTPGDRNPADQNSNPPPPAPASPTFKLSIEESIVAGTCVPLLVETVDKANKTMAPGRFVQLILSGLGNAKIFSDVGCTKELNPQDLPISPSIRQTTYYFRKPSSGVLTIKASDSKSGVNPGSISLTVTPSAAGQLKLSGTSRFRAGQCSGAILGLMQDDFGNSTLISEAVQISLSSVLGGSFYASEDCSGSAISEISVAAQSSQFSFSYKNPQAGSGVLLAEASSTALASSSFAVFVGASRLATQIASSVRSGDCLPFNIRFEDELGNATSLVDSVDIVPSLSAANTSLFDSSDSNCAGTPISSLQLAADSGSRLLHLRAQGSGSLQVGVNDTLGHLATNTGSINIGPRSLSWSGPETLGAGSCKIYEIRALDSLGQLANTLTSVSIGVNDGVGSGSFYSAADTSCSGGALSSATMASGTSSLQLRYRNNKAENVSLSASDNANVLEAASLSVEVGAGRLRLTGPSLAKSNECSLLNVQSEDFESNPVPMLRDTTVNLSDGSAPGSFYASSDATCSGPVINTIFLPKGSLSNSFRYRSSRAQSVTLNADDTSGEMAGGSRILDIGPDRLALSVPSQFRTGDCVPFTVSYQDSELFAANLVQGLTVNFSDAGVGGSFFSDAACSTATASATRTAGNGNFTHYYRNTVAQSLNLTVSDPSTGFLPATQATRGGPYRIEITGPTPILSGTCTLYTIQTRDFAGNLAGVVSTTSLGLADGAAAGVFYSSADTSCTGAAISSLSLPAEQSSIQFRFKNNKAESLSLAASDGASGMVDASLPIVVGPDRLDLAGNASIRSGDCVAYTITSRDTNGTAANVLSLTNINLSDNTPNGDFFSDSLCSTSIASTTMAAGQNLRTLYYRDPIKENANLAIADASSTLLGDNLDVAVGPRRIEITGPTPIRSGTCQLYTLRTRDFAGNLAGVLSTTSLSLADGAAAGVFYASTDSTCTGAVISSVSLPTNQDTIQFRFRNAKAETLTMTASDGASGMDDASMAVVVGPDRLDLAGPTPIRSGDCAAYTVTSRDTNGTAANVLVATTVQLADNTSTGDFFSDSGCSTSIASTSLAVGQNQRTIYYRDSIAEVVSLSATDPDYPTTDLSLLSDTQSTTVGARSIQIAGTTPIRANECSVYTITTRDFEGNLAGVTGATSISIADATAMGVFYASTDSTCTGTAISSISFATNENTKTFRYRDPKAELLTITASDGPSGLNDASFSLRVGPSHLTVNGRNGISWQKCTPYTITARDGTAAAAGVLFDTTVMVGDGTGSGIFYGPTDTTCSGPAFTSQLLPIGSHSVNFYYKNDVRESVVLNADDQVSYLASGSRNVEVGSETLRVTGSTPIRSGECLIYTLTALDAALDPQNILAPVSISVGDGPGVGNFYNLADTTCSGTAVTAVNMPAATSSLQVRYRNTTAQTVVLNLDDGPDLRDAGTFTLVLGPDRLDLQGPNIISKSDCLAYTITTRDTAGNAANALFAATANLSITSGGGAFYAGTDTTCSGTPISSASIGVGQNQVSVRYKNTTSELVSFSVSDPTSYLFPDSMGVEVSSQFINLSGPSPLRASECGLFDLEVRDHLGSPQPVLTTTSIALTDGGVTGDFYASGDTTCTGAIISSVSLGVGTSSTQFRYRSARGQTLTLNADDGTAGRNAGTRSLVIGPDRIRLSSTNPVTSRDCVLITATTRDTLNFGVNATGAVNINLDDGSASGSIYASTDTTCSGANISSVSIASGSQTAQFRYRNLKAETSTINAVDPTSFLLNDNYSLPVGPGRIVLAGTSSSRAGQCLALTIDSLDHTGVAANLLVAKTLTLSSNSTNLRYYASADTSCLGSTISTASMPAGTNRLTLYYRNPRAESATLTVADQASIMESGTFAYTTQASRLQITGSSPIPAGRCQSYTLSSQDETNQNTAVVSETIVSLTDTSSTAFFYPDSDSTCSGAAISQITLAAGTHSRAFRYRNPVAETNTVTADDGPGALTAATRSIVTGPARLSWSGPAGIDQGVCSLFTLSTADMASNPSVTSSDVNINLSDAGAPGSFFAGTDTTCSGAAITSTQILTGQSSRTLRYRSSTVGSVTFSADDASANLLSGTHAVDIASTCPSSFKVEPLLAGAPVSSLQVGQRFHVRLTAVNGSNVTQTCLNGNRTITWTITGAAAPSAACGESILTAEAPSQTTLNFTNGVAETSTATAAFKSVGSGSLSANDGTRSGSSGSISVIKGNTCQIQLRSASGGGGSIVNSQNIDLNVDRTTSNDKFTVYAAGYDAFGNYTADQSVTWSGTGVVYPWPTTTTVASDTARVYGVQAGSGNLRADFDGGDGATGHKTKNITVNVSSVNGNSNWTTSSQDLGLSALVGSNTSRRLFLWDPVNEGGSWRSNSSLSWAAESFAAGVRGSRTQFPDRVLLNATDTGLDIIDATNNQLWMRFNSGSGRAIDSIHGSIQDITALNGIIYVGQKASDSTGTLTLLDFKGDRVQQLRTSGLWTRSGAGFTSRNSIGTWSLSSATPQLVGDSVRALASRKISGLDLIAVATQAGLSLLQDNSGTRSSHSLSSVNAMTSVALSGDARLYFAESTVGLHRSDLSLPLTSLPNPSRTYNRSSAAELPSLEISRVQVGTGTSDVQAGQNSIYAATEFGLAALHEHSTETSSRSRTYSYAGSGIGAFGGALLLDGVNDSVEIPFVSTALGPATGSSVTIEIRLRPQSDMSTGTHVLYSRGTGPGSLGLAIVNGRLEFSYNLAGTVYRTQSTINTWNPGEWVHVAGVLSAAGLESWINGSDRRFVAIDLSAQSVASSATQVGLGFNGALDELRVSRVARYSGASFSPPTSAFVADASTVQLYSFDEGSGNTATATDFVEMATGNLPYGGVWVRPILGGQGLAVQDFDLRQSSSSGGSVYASILTQGTSGRMTQVTGLESRTGASAVRSFSRPSATCTSMLNTTNASTFDSVVGTPSNGLFLYRGN